MKKLILLSALFLVACGEDRQVITDVVDENKGCTVTEQADGSLISCEDGTSAFIPNGQDGADGANGQDGQDGAQGPQGPQGPDGQDGQDGTDGIVELLDPCGDDPNNLDEILIRTSSGDLLAWYLDRGLVVLEPGNYRTTDPQQCRFTVNSDGTITYDLEVQATRERPSGIYIDQEVKDIERFVLPNSFKIVSPSGSLSHSGQQWANIIAGSTKYCYQMTGVTSKTLAYRYSIPATNSCEASTSTPNDGLAGSSVTASSFTVRMQNSVKKGGQHKTTTIEADIEVTR